jgi:hypothetical protein
MYASLCMLIVADIDMKIVIGFYYILLLLLLLLNLYVDVILMTKNEV